MSVCVSCVEGGGIVEFLVTDFTGFTAASEVRALLLTLLVPF